MGFSLVQDIIPPSLHTSLPQPWLSWHSRMTHVSTSPLCLFLSSKLPPFEYSPQRPCHLDPLFCIPPAWVCSASSTSSPFSDPVPLLCDAVLTHVCSGLHGCACVRAEARSYHLYSFPSCLSSFHSQLQEWWFLFNRTADFYQNALQSHQLSQV